MSTAIDWPGDAVEGVPAGTYPILGHGLWGPTLDLGDGTLLKLVRGRAGIGDGRDIHANEARVLSLLDGLRIDRLAVPRLVSHGLFPPRSRAAADGLAAWLRLTRVAGRPIDEDWLSARSAGERERFAASFGAAAAALQRAGTDRLRQRPSHLDDRLHALLRALPTAGAGAADRRLADALLAAAVAIPETKRDGFVHGDLHLHNLLADDAGTVCGIIDFGESGRGFPEIDLAYLQWLPEIETTARRSYEDAAGPIDEHAYSLAGAIYALTAAVIGERAGDAEEAAGERRRLASCLERIGWTPPAPADRPA